MKRSITIRRFWAPLAFVAGLLMPVEPARAYPPAPYHLFHGMLRDEYGTPINFADAEVFLETSGGLKIKTKVNPGIETASNYRLEVPMDSGLFAAVNQPTALRPTAPFRIKVRIGGVVYLPIEMNGELAALGHPGERTLLNLTLGEDLDGDGLPDAWERLINADISQVLPGGDAGNGLNHLETYHAGTYAVDPENGFSVEIAGFKQGAPLLEFLAVTGRTYTILGSSDLKRWESARFRFPTDGATPAIREKFLSPSVRQVQLEVVHEGSDPAPTYFRLMLQ